MLEEIIFALACGEDVKLHNFGAFIIRQKCERLGRNLKTGETAVIKARKVVIFKVSDNMKVTINGV